MNTSSIKIFRSINISKNAYYYIIQGLPEVIANIDVIALPSTLYNLLLQDLK